MPDRAPDSADATLGAAFDSCCCCGCCCPGSVGTGDILPLVLVEGATSVVAGGRSSWSPLALPFLPMSTTKEQQPICLAVWL